MKTTTKTPAPPMIPEGLTYSLSPGQRMGVEILCQRTGLEQVEVLRLLLETGLYVVGLDLAGVEAFEFLLKTTVGEKHLDEALTEAADVNGLQLAQFVANVEIRERRARRAYLAKAEPVQAEA